MVRTLALAAIPAAVALRAPLPAATRPRRSAALRMGLAAALAPTTAKILAALRRRLPSGAPRWVAPVLALAGLVAAFAANAAAALLREVVRVSAVA